MVNKNSLNRIIVAALPAPKLDMYSIETHGDVIHVFDAPIMRILGQIFNVSYTVLTPSNGGYGAKLPN